MQQTTAVMVSGTFLCCCWRSTLTLIQQFIVSQPPKWPSRPYSSPYSASLFLRHSNSFASGVHCSSSTGTNHQKGTRLKDWKLKISDLDEGWDQEDLEKEVTELTVQMMKIDSTTGHEGRVVWFLKEYLEERSVFTVNEGVGRAAAGGGRGPVPGRGRAAAREPVGHPPGGGPAAAALQHAHRHRAALPAAAGGGRHDLGPRRLRREG
ncbi:unnamed protein product, partial [Heterosigma akashiwo]